MAESFKNDGPLVEEYVYDVSGGDDGSVGQHELSAKPRKEPIPAGAVIKRYTRKVETPFAGGGSLQSGDGSNSAAYEAAVLDSALTADSLAEDNAVLKVSDANTGKFVVEVTVAAMTAGKAVYMVEYYNPKG